MTTINGTTNNNQWTYKLEVFEDSYSIENNTSNVTVKVYLGRTSSRSYVGGNWTGTVTVNGATRNVSGTIPYPTYIDGGAWYEIKSETFTSILHNDDGSKTIGVSATMSSTVFTPSSCSASGNVALTTIPRASSISCSGGNIGSATTISISRASSSFTHTLIYSFGSLTNRTIVTKTSSTSVSWTIPTSFYAQIPNSNSGTVTLTCWTYSGSTLVGTSTTTCTVNVTNSNPTFTASQLTYLDSNSSIVAITENNQHIVRNQSNLKVTYTAATAKKGASISKYEITFNSGTQTKTSATTIDYGKVNLSSNATVSVKAIDSRGNSTTISKTVQIKDWVLPSATITANRVNNYEDETHLKANVIISSVNSKNAIQYIKYRYKKSGDTNYGSYVNMSNNVQSTLSLDKLYAWDFQIAIADKFGNTTYNFTIAKGMPIMFIDTKKLSVGINSFPASNNIFNVNGEIRQNNVPISAGGGSSITTTVDVGTTTTGASGTQAKVTNSGNSVNAVFDFVIPRGEKGDKGDPGSGIISGGTTGQVLAKKSNTNYDTEWITPVITETDPIFVASPAYNITSNDITNWNNKSTFSGNYNDLANKPTIPSKTSDLTNDSNFVADASYVHTDNNFTSSLKNKLDGISVGAEVNVQANWNETNTTSDSYIQNKPTIPTVPTNLSSFTDDLGSSPTHTHSQYVEKITGKELSTNDFTNAYKDNVDSNTVARHTHNNKDLLDNISSTDISNWNNKSDFSGSYNDLIDKPLPFEIIQYHVNDEQIIAKLNSCINYESAKLLKMPVLCIPGTSEFGVYGDLSNRSTVYANLVYVTHGTPHKWVFRYLISNDSDFFLGREISYIIENNTITSSEETIKVLKRQELQKRLYSGTDIRKDLLEIIMSIATSDEPNFEKLIDATFFESNIVNNIINANQYNFYNLTNTKNNTVMTFLFKFICGSVIKEIGMSYDLSDPIHTNNYEYWTLTIDGVVQQ